MEIACVIVRRTASSERSGRSGGLRPGRKSLPDPGGETAGGLADPVALAEATEAMARRLEGIGAGVETERAGEAFFAIGGLRGIHGGEVAGVLAAAREAAGGPVRIGAAPTRFAAWAAARRGEARIAAAALEGFLAPLPVTSLPPRLGEPRRAGEDLVEALERLGIETLGALARLGADQVADRFGPLGLGALRLARGEDEPLRPRAPYEELVEEIELPEGIAGRQLDRALELLVDRLLAAPARAGRTLLGLRLGAVLCGGGSWSVDQGLGRPTASALVLRRLLVPRLEDLPGPAAALRLRALGFGPAASDQLEMEVGGAEPRRRRLGAAVREVRAAQGADALLRILPVDSASRVPERWAMLTPFPEL
jgi:protein ImuB